VTPSSSGCDLGHKGLERVIRETGSSGQAVSGRQKAGVIVRTSLSDLPEAPDNGPWFSTKNLSGISEVNLGCHVREGNTLVTRQEFVEEPEKEFQADNPQDAQEAQHQRREGFCAGT